MAGCPNNSCSAPGFNISQNLGDILYNGPYDPQYDNVAPPDHKPPHQNFTVQVPSFHGSGETVTLSVTHLTLVEVSGSSESISDLVPMCFTMYRPVPGSSWKSRIYSLLSIEVMLALTVGRLPLVYISNGFNKHDFPLDVHHWTLANTNKITWFSIASN
ncbi:hypothetical protein AcV7_007045 [Taiwanofungus camphoratus]|nr:hypothetical protein AcV7_007045 [Antrodia cinnamomea]